MCDAIEFPKGESNIVKYDGNKVGSGVVREPEVLDNESGPQFYKKKNIDSGTLTI